MSTIREILESMNQPPAAARPQDNIVGDDQVATTPEIDSPIGDVDTSSDDEAAEQAGSNAEPESNEVAPEQTPEVSPEVAPEAQSDDTASDDTASKDCGADCGEKDKVEEACKTEEDDTEDSTDKIEEEMSMDVVTHPKHGKIAWVNKGEGVHAITKNGKEVFQGTQKEVATRFSAIRKEASTMNEENVVTESFAADFAKSLNEGIEFKIDLSESAISGLVESQGLTEEFSAQAIEIFEAAVNDVAKTHIEKINNYAGYVFESMVASKLEEQETAVQEFLSTVVAEWAEENALAIEQGARVQVAESFMASMQGLLKEHFVEVPEQKADLYESLLEKTSDNTVAIKEAEEQHALETAQLQEEVKSLKKQIVIESVAKGMTELAAEKLRTLASDLVFESEESFSKKLTMLKESYVAPQKKENEVVIEKVKDAILEDIEPLVETEIVEEYVDPAVAALAKSMSRYTPK